MGKGRASKGRECVGLHGKPCQRSRDGKKLPIILNNNCLKCGEPRCKKHCGCRDTALGRSAARGPGAQVLKATLQPSQPARPAAPVGRASAPSVQILEIEEFYAQCCADLANASEAELASYIYDNPSLQDVLLRRLKGRTEFKLNLYVDAELFANARYRHQRPRLKALRDAGAQVFLCKGPGRQGSFHMKALVVDRRYLYSGSPNFTYKSHCNEELCMRITGGGVAKVMEKLSGHRLTRNAWDGA